MTTEDVEVGEILARYREFEQARFVDSFTGRFNPILLEEFLEVVNAIFDVRSPPLLTVLRSYTDMARREREGTAIQFKVKKDGKLFEVPRGSGNAQANEHTKSLELIEAAVLDDTPIASIPSDTARGTDKVSEEDEEDYLDEPDIVIEPKSMKDMELIELPDDYIDDFN